jgi:hypothetical protein
VFIAYAIDLFQHFALHTVRIRIGQWPLGLVIVLRLHDIVEWRDLHVAIQRHNLVLFEYPIDFAQIQAFFGVELVDIRVFAIE